MLNELPRLGSLAQEGKNNLKLHFMFSAERLCTSIKGISDNAKHVSVPRNLLRKSPDFLLLSKIEKSQQFLPDIIFLYS